MQQSTATRHLVKSPPELWAEISSEAVLGRHLADFGEIRITRTSPETTVAWEGDRASGTVELTPTGWETKVIAAPSAGIPGPPVPAPDPSPPAPAPDPGPLPPAPDPVPPTPAPAPPAPQIEVLDPERTAAILAEVLDDLGSARHRPFSRD